MSHTAGAPSNMDARSLLEVLPFKFPCLPSATSVLDLKSCPILELPEDFVHVIMDHVAKEDIPATRQACKSLHDILDFRFLQENFTEKSQLVTLHSLQNLVHITETPRLRDSIKTLTLKIARVPCELQVTYPCGALCTDCDCRQVCKTLLDFDKEEQWMTWGSQWPEADSTCDNNTELELLMRKGRGEELLTTALLNLKQADIIPHLAMGVAHCNCDEPNPEEEHDLAPWLQPLAMRGAIPQLHEDRYVHRKEGMDPTNRGDVSSMLLHAVAAARFPLKSIQLLTAGDFNSNHYYRLDPDISWQLSPLAVHSQVVQTLSSCIGNLTSLHIGDAVGNRDLVPLTWKPSFRQLMQAARSLTHLTLDFADYSSVLYSRSFGVFWYDHDWIRDTFTSCPLTHLTLVGGVMSVATLDHVLYKYKKKVKHFRLERMICGEADPLCHWIAENMLELESCEIIDIDCNFYKTHGNHFEVADEDPKVVRAKLLESVNSGYWYYKHLSVLY